MSKEEQLAQTRSAIIERFMEKREEMLGTLLEKSKEELADAVLRFQLQLELSRAGFQNSVSEYVGEARAAADAAKKAADAEAEAEHRKKQATRNKGIVDKQRRKNAASR